MPADSRLLPPLAEPPRLISLDAYRGFVMICLAANGFGIARVAREFPESSLWQHLGYQFEHVPWVGCAFWDLIQPSFMFMVGVAMPFSYGKRRERGDSWLSMAGHAFIRSIILICLGVALRSISTPETNFTFVDVLSQIGLGYFFLFLLWNLPTWAQCLAATGILGGYWGWFAATPIAPLDYDWQAVGVPPEWPFLQGFAAHWEKNANPAHVFDVWFYNLFPTIDGKPVTDGQRWLFNSGGYQTLNFIPSLATMLFGVIAGEGLRTATNRINAWFGLVCAGVVLLLLGWGLGEFGVCPVVKRIWTPTWTLYSTGITLLMLSGFYLATDVMGWRAWAFPLVIAGANSILLYVLGNTLRSFTATNLKKHFGDHIFEFAGPALVPIVESCAVLLVFWLFVYWLYRQKAFVRI